MSKTAVPSLADLPIDFLDRLSRLTYLNAIEAAIYLRRPSLKALYHFIDTHKVHNCGAGRSLLFLRRDLDEAVGNVTDGRRARRRSLHAAHRDADSLASQFNPVERIQ